MGAASVLLSRGRPHLKSAGWSSAEYVFYPVLMFIATPVLVANLGLERYGLFMLVNSIAGLGGAATSGMGSATIKFVSANLERGDRGAAAAVVRATLLLALLGSALVAVLLALNANGLAQGVFARMGRHDEVVFAIFIAAAIITLMQIDAVFASALKGMENFSAAARLDMFFKLAVVASAMLISWLTGSVRAVLVSSCALLFMSAVTKGYAVGRLMGETVFLPKKDDRSSIRLVFSFAAWNSLIGIGGLLFVHADRIIIGSVLGASAVSYYTICTQLAQQVHALPAAAMSFLFPLMSRKSEAGDVAGIARVRRYGVRANILIAATLSLVLFLLGEPLLEVWMGRDFAIQAHSVFLWLVFAYFVLALNVAPHYLVLGTGHARYASVTSLVGGALGVIMAFLLVPSVGVVGAAQARLVMGVSTLANYYKLYRRPSGS
jgi:O-antigen/teichoic acid export membrane protein